MLHNFKVSLQHEREQAEKADKFYKTVLGATRIQRFNTESDADMFMQRQDVDLVLELKNVSYKISEKFRDKDYADLFVEVFSKYPETQGWLFTGSPNAILYFTPQNVYWITHTSLKKFCVEKLFPAINNDVYDYLYHSHKTIISKNVIIENISVPVNFIQAHNKDGEEWETIGIAVKFEVLEKFGVKYRKYPLKN